MAENDGPRNKLVPFEDGRIEDGRSQSPNSLQSAKPSPLEIAGQIANRAAGQSIFQRYLSEKSANTIKRHARDLELFAEYLIDAQIPLENGANFQINPLCLARRYLGDRRRIRPMAATRRLCRFVGQRSPVHGAHLRPNGR